MVEKIIKHQRLLLAILIVACTGVILAGGINYLHTLQDGLERSAIQEVMSATQQQQRAFDNFINEDRDRLQGYADYLSKKIPDDPAEAKALLNHLFRGTDAACVVVCLDEGWAANSAQHQILQLEGEGLESYRSLTGSGIRDSFAGVFTGLTKFGYYDTFTFPNGHKGVVEKGYNRNQILETFSLSFYDGQGFGYILDQEGDILLRSVPTTGKQFYHNVFVALTDTHTPQADIDSLRQAIGGQEPVSLLLTGDNGSYIYACTPLESAPGWSMLAIVPVEAIRAESDKILRNSKLTLELLILLLFVFIMFILLLWRTQKEMAAKDKETRYQAKLFEVFISYLSSNADDVYIMLDHRTDELQYVSPNVERVLGAKPEEVIDALQASDMETDPEGARLYYTGVTALAPGQAAKSRYTERIHPLTGEHRFFWESAYCADIEGSLKRVVYISDRTREWNSRNHLAEALRMAKAANAAKSAFLSSVSHDIRTPMNAIIGFLALMQNDADDPAIVREYAQRIEAASQHLLELINNVLDMNKIESGSSTLNISEMNLAEVIDEINTIIRPQTKARNQTFDIFVSHLAYEHLMGDKLRLNQILINLLSNAVKYTQDGGTIELRVKELPQVVNNYSRVRFTVSDNGMGMSEEYLKIIFDPFTREETKNTRQIQGTGLGMAITKSLVDLMGGTIRVESTLGEGSTFTVELELCIQDREEDPAFWTDYGVARMIVADDDEEVCQNIVRTMAQTGVAVDYATDGEAAIQMMRTTREAGRPYDLILLDWKMPNLNGLETARLIRKNYSDKIPILLLTAYDWSDIEQEAMEIGVNHFMPKPFFISTFKDAIRRVMGSPKKAESLQSDVFQGKRVLVVDDIEVNRIILVKILETQGAVCDTAGNGQEAVDKFLASRPGEYDLILMDVQMPVMDGYTATKTIRRGSHPSAREVPIIAMTANAFVDDVREAMESGMDAHIAKPVQMEKLRATVQQVLDSRAALGEIPNTEPTDEPVTT